MEPKFWRLTVSRRLVLKGGKEVGALIDDLLASRIDRVELRMTLVSLSELAGEVMREMQPQTEARDIRWKIATSLPSVYDDRSMPWAASWC